MIFDLNQFTIIHYPRLGSSNNEAMRLAVEGASEYTVVLCEQQTAGRGQRDNGWESEAGKNLTLSIIVRPNFLPADQLFLLSKAFSVAVCCVLLDLHLPACIKWPNDLYVGDKKIAGILLEHSFSGNHLLCSIIGLGLNVNQTCFLSSAPNPTSIALESGNQIDLQTICDSVLNRFYFLYENLKANNLLDIETAYMQCLYRKDGYHPYRRPNGELFDARIVEVRNTGELILALRDGSLQSFFFKEVSIVMPKIT